MNNNQLFVGTFEANTFIGNSVAGIPDRDHSVKALYAATGTPIKLTKSLPAKANARAKVPTIIMSL
mgnify:CR=1 FL=1